MSARRRLRIAVPIVMAVLAVGTYTFGTHADPLPRPAVVETADTTAANTPAAVAQLLAQVETVDSLADVDGYDRSCKKGSAPLTELNAEWCRSEGVGSMWVGSLRT